ncbi:Glucosamine inositolphosphorylceramide transferase 1 like protein [Verticillium longisporum]|nr:Glucosamine inositolphosphorylceramide transferase 1 like protein [Verticillium longisporum]
MSTTFPQTGQKGQWLDSLSTVDLPSFNPLPRDIDIDIDIATRCWSTLSIAGHLDHTLFLPTPARPENPRHLMPAMYKSDGTTTTSVLKNLPQWLTKRHVLFALALATSLLLLFSFNSWGPEVHLPHVTTGTADAQKSSSSNSDNGVLRPQCAGRDKVASLNLWDESQSKYSGLMDDKFTIAIQTYRRPDELNQTLHLLTDNVIPSLNEIVIVWNDLESTPPPNFVSAHGVGVRYRVSRRNSLNEKLFPDPEYKTKAILLSDDDVHYPPADLDFVFQTWRKYGRHRLTAFAARRVAPNTPLC